MYTLVLVIPDKLIELIELNDCYKLLSAQRQSIGSVQIEIHILGINMILKTRIVSAASSVVWDCQILESIQ